MRSVTPNCGEDRNTRAEGINRKERRGKGGRGWKRKEDGEGEEGRGRVGEGEVELEREKVGKGESKRSAGRGEERITVGK